MAVVSEKPVIALCHSYLLEGSGSNLWTRAIVRSLVMQGAKIELVCQENHPEIYDFISKVKVYKPDGTVETTLDRPSIGSGSCTMHKPVLGDTLLVYVRDRYEEFPNVVPMVEATDEQIADYVNRNVEVLMRVCKENGVTAIHANHAVLASVYSQRVAKELKIPFAVMPHGSAIEYAVKKDARFMELAVSAFSDAAGLFVIGDELRSRVVSLMGDRIPDVASKMHTLNLGVDTALFKPIMDLSARAASIDELGRLLETVERGKTPAMTAELLADVQGLVEGAADGVPSKDALTAAFKKSEDRYTLKNTDAGVEEKLKGVDWSKDKLLLFVGRLIANKGLQSVVFALPKVLAVRAAAGDTSRVRLVVIGHGPQREIAESLVWAMANGHRKYIEALVGWGSELEGLGECEPWLAVRHFLDAIDAEGPGRLDEYFAQCKEHITLDTVIFTGYLTHRELRCLFPCVDIGLFPSVVAEAGPLVFLEALASGAFPLGTYFAGMQASIDTIAGDIPEEDAADVDIMKLSPDAKHTVADIAKNLPLALAIGTKHRETLRRVAVERFDWAAVTLKMTQFFVDAAKK